MDIIVYSNGCPQCKILEEKLKSKNIQYVKTEDFDKIIENGFKSVPVLEINGELFGFRKAIEWINGK